MLFYYNLHGNYFLFILAESGLRVVGCLLTVLADDQLQAVVGRADQLATLQVGHHQLVGGAHSARQPRQEPLQHSNFPQSPLHLSVRVWAGVARVHLPPVPDGGDAHQHGVHCHGARRGDQGQARQRGNYRCQRIDCSIVNT